MSKLKIIAPIHSLYDGPRDHLPDQIELDQSLIIRRKGDDLARSIKVITSSFESIYSKADIEDLKNCRFYVSYIFDDEKESKKEAQDKIHHIIEILRIVRPNRASCFTFLFSLKENGDLNPEGASGKSNAVFLIYGEPVGSQHFHAHDEHKIKKYYSCISRLYSKYGGNYNRILNAYIFFQLGYLTHYTKLRIVPFTIALESLFNTSEQETGYSLRMRCAAFLGKTKDEKESLMCKIKSIYEVRSAAVHGLSLPKKVLKNLLESNKIWRDAEEISRRCLQKIFDEDLIDIFSQPNDKLSKYLDDLLFT